MARIKKNAPNRQEMSTRRREARKYMKKALDFGIESGYLISSDSTYRILCVSSNLMKNDSQRNKISTCDMDLFKNRDTPIILDDLQEQKRRQRRRGWRRRDQRLRSASRTRHRSRRRRRKSRSRSRSRGCRRHSSLQNPEEIAEDEVDDYEMDENDPKSNIHTDDIEKQLKTARSNPDEEQSMKTIEKDGSDLFIDENEIDDENEKKKIDITKS